MKAILSLVIVGLLIGCSGDDNPANSNDNSDVIVGCWNGLIDGFNPPHAFSHIEYEADRTRFVSRIIDGRDRTDRDLPPL